MTRKLYEEQVYLKTCEAKVIGREGLYYEFNQTIFFPEGGGQSADSGTINGIEVIDVKEKGHRIVHQLAAPLKSDEVTMHLDWEKRFDEMQQHCGEHILSGIIMDHYRGKNKGFHIGKEYVTIDIDETITSDMLDHIENLANAAIYENIPLQFDIMQPGDDYPLRKEPTVEEDIRIVSIPGVDCVACCGTHPSRTGEVGIIKLYKVEKNKGMSRIFFKCGKRALMDLQRKTAIVQYFNQEYSADDQTVIERFEQDKEKQEKIKKEYIELSRKMIDETIENQLTDGAFQIFEFNQLTSKDMNYVIKKVSEKANSVLLITSQSEMKIMLSHDGSHAIPCGKLFKNIKDFGGRGGGNMKTAQGVFTDLHQLDSFKKDLIERIKKQND